MIESLYKPYDNEISAFGSHWCGPEAYESWKEALVAEYVSGDDDDGQSVNVYCAAAPARFYRLEVLPGVNSVGKQQAGYEVATGSGCYRLSAELAKAISEGMIGFSPKEPSK